MFIFTNKTNSLKRLSGLSTLRRSHRLVPVQTGNTTVQSSAAEVSLGSRYIGVSPFGQNYIIRVKVKLKMEEVMFYLQINSKQNAKYCFDESFTTKVMNDGSLKNGNSIHIKERNNINRI